MYNYHHVTESAICDAPCEMLYKQSLDATRIRPRIYEPENIRPDDAANVRLELEGDVSEMSRSYDVEAAALVLSKLMTPI